MEVNLNIFKEEIQCGAKEEFYVIRRFVGIGI